jgi:hypothetical protein
MMKIFFGLLFLATPAFSKTLVCNVQEFWNRLSTEQVLEVSEQSQDPHGSIQTFELQHFSGYSGFVAVVKGTTVIHLSSPDAQYAYTAHGRLALGGYTSLQVLLPSKPDEGLTGVLIQCALKSQEL